MSLIDKAAAQLDAADLIILANVETLRDQQQPATASALASLIGGAGRRVISDRLAKLSRLKLIDPSMDGGMANLSWSLTPMGAELLFREMPGWTPSPTEQIRRDAQLRSAGAGVWRA